MKTTVPFYFRGSLGSVNSVCVHGNVSISAAAAAAFKLNNGWCIISRTGYYW